MPSFNRRNFLKASGLGLLPAVLPTLPAFASDFNKYDSPTPGDPIVRFFGDGIFFDGTAYLEQLQEANTKKYLQPDRYGAGGAIAELEKRFVEITGKQKAIFLPTGTMANQFAIAVLSEENTKVFVQDESHVYRDEADAAQSVFNKRLHPLAKGKTYFTADELKQAIDNLEGEEVFKSGVGCVSIENPVRRMDGRAVPLEEIKKISEYCRSHKIKLHLDGARIYMTSAATDVSIKEYSSYFDTVYISLYKYLGASGGAVLCGDKDVIEKMPHMMKIHGGSMFGNWLNASMALHRLDGLEERLKNVKQRAESIFKSLNEVEGVKISALDGGTNIYNLHIPTTVNPQKFSEHLRNNYSIWVPRPNASGDVKITINESWLFRDEKFIVDAIKDALKK